MTSNFTILCPHGIVLAADGVVTKRNPFSGDVEKIYPYFRKIYKFSKTKFGVSCWGLGRINGLLILDFLAEFDHLLKRPIHLTKWLLSLETI